MKHNFKIILCICTVHIRLYSICGILTITVWGGHEMASSLLLSSMWMRNSHPRPPWLYHLLVSPSLALLFAVPRGHQVCSHLGAFATCCPFCPGTFCPGHLHSLLNQLRIFSQVLPCSEPSLNTMFKSVVTLSHHPHPLWASSFLISLLCFICHQNIYQHHENVSSVRVELSV